MNCYRCFIVDIMKLYISALDHARKLKFKYYINLLSINKMFQCCYALVILCNVGEAYIFELKCYISALGHVSVLILSRYVLLA